MYAEYPWSGHYDVQSPVSNLAFILLVCSLLSLLFAYSFLNASI